MKVKVKYTVQMWAVLKASWEKTEESPGEYNYELRFDGVKPFREGAVQLSDQGPFYVELDVDETGDIPTKMVEALNEVILEEKLECSKKVIELEGRIQSLLALPNHS